MEQIVLELPAMYADHHVLAVRRALQSVKGVDEVVASAMEQRVWIRFDPAQATAPALTEALEAAGYPVGQPPELILIEPAINDGSAWYQMEPRYTETNVADLKMSGDFRKY
ncbi:MAG: heavy-metal-associated domain-containing protein [Chloroflexi bacterium]|nr:heavy-metal-associated domain-containing protein [Chloroflexota bacterium]